MPAVVECVIMQIYVEVYMADLPSLPHLARVPHSAPISRKPTIISRKSDCIKIIKTLSFPHNVIPSSGTLTQRSGNLAKKGQSYCVQSFMDIFHKQTKLWSTIRPIVVPTLLKLTHRESVVVHIVLT